MNCEISCEICGKEADQVTTRMVCNECAAREPWVAVFAAAQLLLDSWDAKPPLVWQPELHRELLEGLRAALLTATTATRKEV